MAAPGAGATDAQRACPACGYLPGWGERVVGECVPERHDLALVDWPTREEEFADAVECWLAAETEVQGGGVGHA